MNGVLTAKQKQCKAQENKDASVEIIVDRRRKIPFHKIVN